MGLLADPQRRRASPGVHCTRQADPADLDDGAVGRQRGHPAGHEGDHRAPRRRGRGRQRRGDPGLRRRRARRGRSPGRARRRRRPARGGSVSRRILRHHRSHLGLVGAAAAGDRGLHLAGGVQGHRDPGPGRRDDRDRAGLGGAHHGADVVLAEHPLDRDRVRPVLGAARPRPRARWPAAGRRCRRPAGCAPRRPPPACSGRPATPSTTPSPHRVRPGSTPSTRTVVPPTCVRTPVRDERTGDPAHDPAATRRRPIATSLSGVPSTTRSSTDRTASRTTSTWLTRASRRRCTATSPSRRPARTRPSGCARSPPCAGSPTSSRRCRWQRPRAGLVLGRHRRPARRQQAGGAQEARGARRAPAAGRTEMFERFTDRGPRGRRRRPDRGPRAGPRLDRHRAPAARRRWPTTAPG